MFDGVASSNDGEKGGEKPVVRGKFLFAGTRKIYIRGVTYGAFRPDDRDDHFPSFAVTEQDFAQMKASGINAVRVYTPPPAWLLDLAWKYELYVMIGLPWEQHIAFLDQPGLPASIEKRVRAAVRASRDHPAVLCYVVGNEIPAPIVRWHGRRSVERFIYRLYKAVKDEAPDTLVTYVNYPTTEYLNLPFLDFLSFNVYLEAPDKLQAYLAQLQNLAGDRPLVMTEIGLDSRRNGVLGQAQSLDWQIRTIFASGCAGLFVFAWTDEWHRGGFDIQDWDFGLTTRDRESKPALAAVGRAFRELPFPSDIQWPRISVVVCTYNGARTLRNCLEGLKQLEYPNHEVILVDDGSTDDSAGIAQQYPVRLIRQNNEGLSSARNTGLEASTGDIVAYIDDDAWPDPHWLHYLAWTYMNSDYVAVGGPNIPPPNDGPLAECVANSPGGPAHVMITHCDAEHIPGCNCSFLTSELRAIGGFDKQFRTAGDDVDLCWRLLERGGKIGFHAGAMVWHHRRGSIRAYLKQQTGYGRAEALLEAKWPAKYNESGGVMWAGRVYGNEFSLRHVRQRIYQGRWGSAPFQRLYADQTGSVMSSPGWYWGIAILAGLFLLSGQWDILRFFAIPLFLLLLMPFVHAYQGVAGDCFSHGRVRYRALTALLHVLQPAARSWGRVTKWISIQKRPALSAWLVPRSRVLQIWSEQWHAPEQWLEMLEERLRSHGAIVRHGDDFASWDLEVAGLGLAGNVRVTAAVEEHGAGRQMVLLRLRPRLSQPAAILAITLGSLTAVAVMGGNFLIAELFAGTLIAMVVQAANGSARAAALVQSSILSLNRRVPSKAMTSRVADVGATLRKAGEDVA